MYTNNCLPQYFFGDKMNQDEHEQSSKININLGEDVHLNLSSIPSPSSSLASTKKLEWDSGADIGYIYDSVKNHRKSKSYPSLNMDKTNIQPMTSIGEGDTLGKEQQNKKPKSFKHSTPLDRRRTMKSCGDSPINLYENKDACLQTSTIHKSSKEVQTDEIIKNEDKSLQTDRLRSSTASSSTSKTSKSGSFKYIPGSEINSYSSTKSKSISSSSKSSKTKTETSDSGSCSPLGQMISTQHSQNLILDIDRSLAILQKFIKSRNYSNDTKKHYAKKIVTKIINNRYSEDSESIESPQSRQFVDCGIQCDQIQKKSQIISEQSNCQIKESLDKLNALQVDLKNWRDSQTLSEKLFEARKTRNSKPPSSEHEKSDYLIQHSKNERKRQISWINNEILYLQKLKELLQIKEKANNTYSSTSTTRTATSTTKKSSVENIDDIEKRFNEEFGLQPSSSSAKDKLSTYLSNEQIKTIVECETHKNKKEASFNSHKNSIYVDKTQLKEKTTVPVDAATQYSLTETKNESPLKEANFDDASTLTSTCDESIIIQQQKPQIKQHSTNNKINGNDKKNIKVNNKLSTAYFLTFEEESQSDFDVEERNSLEEVVVKIPKSRHLSLNNNNNVNDRNNSCPRTLEEYLLKNRPNYVENANWRWAQVRSLTAHHHQNVFTCFEMKEMARKKYNNLPEMQEKKRNYKTLLERTENRFKANIFSKKLQRKTLQGHICLATCKSVMASD